jgi:pteridine reductase
MNKTILITGAAQRIGKEIALSFFNKGWDIVIHFNSSRLEAEALADKMNSERSNSAMIVQANLDNADEVTKLVKKTLSKNSRIGSNLKAPLFLIQSFHKELEKNQGFIINITDINVDKALINHSIYLAAKSGLQTLTKSLAKELAPNIRVNAIAPGAILEPPNIEWTTEQKKNIIHAVPMKRMGTEKDIVDAAMYLSEAEYVTGQILNIDGGKSL